MVREEGAGVCPGQSAAAGWRYLKGDVCLSSWRVKAGGCRGTLPAFFSMLAKKTENSSEALAAGLTDTKQPRSKAQRWDFKAIQLLCLLQENELPPGKEECSELRLFSKRHHPLLPLPAAEHVLTTFQVTGFHPPW